MVSNVKFTKIGLVKKSLKTQYDGRIVESEKLISNKYLA